MLTKAKLQLTGRIPALRQSAGLKRGDPAFPITAEELLLFGRCPRRWLNTTDDPEPEPPSLQDLVRVQYLESPDAPPHLVPRPQTYDRMRLTCPKCQSTGTGKVCTRCGVGRANVVRPAKWSAAAKHCAAWEKQTTARGQQVVSTAKWEAAAAAVAGLSADPSIARLHESSERLVTITGTWVDDATALSIPLTALIDWAPKIGSPLDNTLASLKITQDASHASWAITCYAAGYHLDACLKQLLWAVATSDPRPLHLWNLLERQAPYLVARRQAPAQLLQAGRDLLEALLRAYAHCLHTGLWPEFDSAGKLTADDWSPVYMEEWLTQGQADSPRRYFALSAVPPQPA